MADEVEFLDEDVLVWVDDSAELQVAIRRDFGWPSGQWSVAYHRYRRLHDRQVRELLQSAGAKWYRADMSGTLSEVHP